MLEPAVLFLDEPFAGVHPRLRDELLERIRELHRGGRTFVVVDHDMESILRISRRLVVMARGRKIADGAPDTVRADQAGLAAYAGLWADERAHVHDRLAYRATPGGGLPSG